MIHSNKIMPVRSREFDSPGLQKRPGDRISTIVRFPTDKLPWELALVAEGTAKSAKDVDDFSSCRLASLHKRAVTVDGITTRR